MKYQLPYIYTLCNIAIRNMTHENKIPEISVLYDRGIRNIILEKASYPVDYIKDK